MKGPKILYSCQSCDNLIFRCYFYNCKILSENISIPLEYKTPKTCPYLIKTNRKEKLLKLKS